jgi:hypothetical protein
MPRAFQSPARDSKERARDTRRCIGSCLSKMSRAVLLCCTTLALLFSVGAAHAQQGNLPTPVQKLPAYPPVACVTPDWRPEPCEDRNANRIGWWQCGNVQVTVLLKDDVSVEYRVTGIEKSNNRFTLRPKDELYLNGKLCTPLGEFGKTKPEAPPATTQLPEPVKCLKPDGTEEPCESRHTAQNQDRPPSIPQVSCRQIDNCAPVEPAVESRPAYQKPIDCLTPAGPGLYGLGSLVQMLDCSWLGTVTRTSYPDKPFNGQWPLPKITVFHDKGGDMSEYVARWQMIGAQKNQVEILGPCYSGCTFAVSYVPKARLCFGKDASLAFHMARRAFNGPIGAQTTQWMIDSYPADIRDWLEAKGGFNSMPVWHFWILPAEELWEMGYRKCSD